MVAGQVLARCVSSRSSWVTGDLASAEWRRRGLYQPSIHVNTAIFASALLLQVRRAISSHSSVRSAERRVGTECGSTCRTRWSPEHYIKNTLKRIEKISKK